MKIFLKDKPTLTERCDNDYKTDVKKTERKTIRSHDIGGRMKGSLRQIPLDFEMFRDYFSSNKEVINTRKISGY